MITQEASHPLYHKEEKTVGRYKYICRFRGGEETVASACLGCSDFEYLKAGPSFDQLLWDNLWALELFYLIRMFFYKFEGLRQAVPS